MILKATFKHKMENKKYHTVRINKKFNRKIVEGSKHQAHTYINSKHTHTLKTKYTHTLKTKHTHTLKKVAV